MALKVRIAQKESAVRRTGLHDGGLVRLRAMLAGLEGSGAADDDEEQARARLAAQRAALGVDQQAVEQATVRVLGPACAECGSRADGCRCGWPEPDPAPDDDAEGGS